MSIIKQFDLDGIKHSIAKKYNWESSENWTNFHFKTLSNDIEAVTGDRISEETLKRIFGKRKVSSGNYQPQAYSQIALVKFVGSFKNAGENSIFNNLSLKKIGYALAGLSIIVVLFFFISSLPGKMPAFKISCVNPIDDYPFTATFKYNISEIRDSVFADFGDNKETYIPPEKSMINHFYTIAGLYNVLFYTRSCMIDSLEVVCTSPEWQGGFYPNEYPQLFKLFQNQELYRQSQCFFASEEELGEVGIDLKQRHWIAYRYYSVFDKSLDNLILETLVFNNETTGSLPCYDIKISLIGESGLVDFKFTQPKCSRHVSLRVSEKYLDGQFNDLNALSVDMSDWLQIKMTTEDGSLKLYLAEELVFKESYEQPLGNLVGIEYAFFGSGKIDKLKLLGQDGIPFYENNFSGVE